MTSSLCAANIVEYKNTVGAAMNQRYGMACMMAASLLLAACASSGPVTQLGQDTYMLTASSRWHGNDGVAIQGLQQADAYCKNLGGRMRVVGSERSEGVVFFLPPKALITFKCDKVS
ncbi:hypothetical protein FB597_10226 [Herbaspirillum sp. SJZ099]|nr:hypothetical protein FB597_10226 [Herbaspirillum sp. SJZ099]